MIKKIHILFILLIPLMSSCNKKPGIQNNLPSEEKASNKISIRKDTLWRDSKRFVNLINSTDGQFWIEWGDELSSKTTPEEIHFPPNVGFWVKENRMGYVVLEMPCGTECFFSYVVGFGEIKTFSEIWFPYAYDLNHNLVAHSRQQTDPDLLMVVTNVLTGTSTEIREKYCDSHFSGNCIDSVAFTPTGEEIFIKWNVGGLNTTERKAKFFKLN